MPDLNDVLKRVAERFQSMAFDAEPQPGVQSEPFVLLIRADQSVYLKGADEEAYGESVQMIYEAVERREDISRDAVSRLVADSVVALAQSKRQEPGKYRERVTAEIVRIRSEL